MFTGQQRKRMLLLFSPNIRWLVNHLTQPLQQSHLGLDMRSNNNNIIKKENMLCNLPYTHTALFEDHSLFQAPSLPVSNCRGHRTPPALNHMNPCHKSHSADPPPQACTHTAPAQAHRMGWGNPGGRSHMGRSHLGGTNSNNQTHSGHKRDLEGERKGESCLRNITVKKKWE